MEAVKATAVNREWMRRQLELAREVVDNPGGGLVSATQAIGQVRAALGEDELLSLAEEAVVARQLTQAKELLTLALNKLEPTT